ncbi:MAG: CDC48 family AAA ATPase, partial [Candidatus Bathyarchaeia archaeon]
MKEKEVILKVKDAQQRDVGRGIARVDPKVIEELGLTSGDVIEIIGKKRTAAICWPGHQEDYGKRTIRIDGYIRNNAGVSIDDNVKISKIHARKAEKVVLAPTEPLRIVGGEEYLSSLLDGRVVSRGDVIPIGIMGRKVDLVVSSIQPAVEAVIVSDDTNIVIGEPMKAPLRAIPRVTYEDIGGLKDEIQKIREMIELPLRHPELFERLGVEAPKGVLLHGPPGTGKTLLAKAVANETNAHFISISGPEIMSKFYGESEERLREIFKEAQENAPSIIFIDEVDAIAPKREEVTGEVERRVVSQLLALMDGLQSRGKVVVIGATNRPNAIDPALRRPGRFDREIEIGVPDRQGRLEILQIHTRNMPLAKDVDLKQLAEMTHGYTGADIAALCREAAMKALRRYLPEINIEEERIPPHILEKMEVNMNDFLLAYREVTPTAMREVFIEVPNVTWDDVGDLKEVKQELKEAVEWPIKKPEVFKRLGIKPPKGILLYGPPGCGKTLLAKAVANESEANFISIKGPEIFSKWVGESEKAIREVFRKARTAAPAIIFFDEIDAIVPRRGSGYGDSGVTERVISQLLTELDGIESLDNVVVIAATNRPDMLDPAILRPGRFDRIIYVPPLNEETRLEVFKIHTRNMPLAKDVDLKQLAEMTPNYSGADIEAVCREAAMIALRKNMEAKEVIFEDFKTALNKIKPSLTSEMENWYQNFFKRFRK